MVVALFYQLPLEVFPNYVISPLDNSMVVMELHTLPFLVYFIPFLVSRIDLNSKSGAQDTKHST